MPVARQRRLELLDNMAAGRVFDMLKVVESQLRHLTLRSVPTARLHSNTMHPATFSVSRASWGKSPSEMEEQKGIPEPPRQKIHHCLREIRCGPRKMNLVARQIRGLGVEEAVKQMEFSPKRAAISVKQAIEQAQNIAQQKYGIEDKNDLWVAESYVGKGRYLKRLRYHARGRFGIEHRKYCHFFLVLEEGPVKQKNVRRRLKNMTEVEEIKRHPRHIRNSLAWW